MYKLRDLETGKTYEDLTIPKGAELIDDISIGTMQRLLRNHVSILINYRWILGREQLLTAEECIKRGLIKGFENAFFIIRKKDNKAIVFRTAKAAAEFLGVKTMVVHKVARDECKNKDYFMDNISRLFNHFEPNSILTKDIINNTPEWRIIKEVKEWVEFYKEKDSISGACVPRQYRQKAIISEEEIIFFTEKGLPQRKLPIAKVAEVLNIPVKRLRGGLSYRTMLYNYKYLVSLDSFTTMEGAIINGYIMEGDKIYLVKKLSTAEVITFRNKEDLIKGLGITKLEATLLDEGYPLKGEFLFLDWVGDENPYRLSIPLINDLIENTPTWRYIKRRKR